MNRTFIGLISVFSVLLAASPVTAGEACGLESVRYVDAFMNGFEAPGTLAAKSIAPVPSRHPTEQKATRLGKPLGFAKAIEPAGIPTITITSPLPGAQVLGKRVQVRGTYTGPENTGISVNEQTAFVLNGEFITPDLKLQDGSFDLVAKATTLDGLSATATRSITANTAAAPDASFGLGPVAGLNELGLTLKLDISSGVNPQAVSIDFDGDATPDYSGGVPTAAQLRRLYANPGIYRVSASITSTNPGNPVYNAERLLIVLDLAEHRNRICSPFGALRSRLAADDLPGSLRVFPSNVRPTYEAYFTALGSNRPIFATRLGTIGNGLIGLGEASLMLIASNESGTIGYPITIAQGNDGVWRIESL